MDTTTSSPKAYRTSSSTKLNSIVSAAFTVALAASALGLAGSAFAETPDGNLKTVSAEVIYSDLDLSSPDGARTLLKRFDRAAKEACGGQPTYSPLLPREPARFRTCVQDAITTAVRELDAPVVTAMHNETAVTAVTRLASR